MFVSGQSLAAGLVFSFMSYIVAVPSAIKVFNWTATLHKGWVHFDAPMLYALAFIGLFTIGGLTGLFLACLAYDVYVTDTYFVVAHFHYIMVGGMVTAYFGGLHYWWPKITGRLYPEYWARAAAILIFAGFNLTFFPQFILGVLGMPRRYHVTLLERGHQRCARAASDGASHVNGEERKSDGKAGRGRVALLDRLDCHGRHGSFNHRNGDQHRGWLVRILPPFKPQAHSGKSAASAFGSTMSITTKPVA
jgi:hypothetical protein